MVQLTQTLAFALLAATSIAHPGHSIKKDIVRRQAHFDHPEYRSLAHCKKDLEASGWIQEQAERRHAKINKLRAELGSKPLVRRDPAVDVEEFAQACSTVLDPEVTEGPYWVSGELIRSNVTAAQKGVMTYLDINVVDVTTCKPVTNAYVELWGCNSTGVYTGVVAKGNGDGSANEINDNDLRGIQPTSVNGTASFLTVIPGHYVGRANHLHTIIHHGATLLANNTITGGTISHVGQFYVEQTMLATIEKTSPYSTNTQAWMQNSQDQLFTMGKGNGDDPTLHITLLGADVTAGVHATIDVGVNPSAQQRPQAVNRWTATGGVPIPGSMWAGYPWTKKERAANEAEAPVEESAE